MNSIVIAYDRPFVNSSTIEQSFFTLNRSDIKFIRMKWTTLSYSLIYMSHKIVHFFEKQFGFASTGIICTIFDASICQQMLNKDLSCISNMKIV